MSRRIRSVLARGNGAVIVHRELVRALPDYRLHELDPRIAALPPCYRLASRRALADAEVAHLAVDYGVAPVPADCARVVTFHNFYIDAGHLALATPAQRLYYRAVMTPAVRAALGAADHIVVVSRFLADCVRALAPTVPIEVIHNGIDVARFVPAPAVAADARPLRVLFVGNPSRRKGFHLLQQIAAALPAGVELAFTAGLRAERVAGTPGLVALGQVPYEQMHRLYQQADVLLFPTRREGFGLCVAEAMACGLPVVSSRCSAIPELVDEDRGGFLLPPDDVAGMVAALHKLLAEPALRADMGAYNRERAVRDFALPRMLAQYRELFSAVRRR